MAPTHIFLSETDGLSILIFVKVFSARGCHPKDSLKLLLKINREKYLTPIELVGPQDVYQMMNVLNTNSSGVYSNREEGILGTWDEYDEGLKVYSNKLINTVPTQFGFTQFPFTGSEP